MPMLYINCPKTGIAIPTGIDLPKDASLLDVEEHTAECKECSETHQWDGKDAFFEDGTKLSHDVEL